MKKIGYSSPFVPGEWIEAHGWGAWRVVPEDGGDFVAAGVCAFAAAFGRCAAEADAVVVASTCDQMRRMAERILPGGSRVFLMNVPATWQTRGALELYTDELRRLGRFLVRHGGTAPMDGDLAAVMRRHDAMRRAIRIAPFVGKGVRLGVVGSPLRGQDRWLLECIEAAGGYVALDATEGGERCLPGPFEEGGLVDDPLGELARAYFLAIPDAFRRPDTLLHEYLRRSVAGRRIQGIVLVRYVWCDQWHAQVQRLKETLKIPVIEIDLGGRDHDLQRTRTRIESLVGILQ